MLKLIDVVYYSHMDSTSPEEVIKRHKPSLGFVEYIKNKMDISLVKHCNYEGMQIIDHVKYAFFKRSNSFFQIPFKTNQYIKQQLPDVVIINGLIFPLQVIALRLTLGKKCLLLVQHHGEIPYPGIKGLFQKLADKYISAYLFTAKENAREWIEKQIIKDSDKCYELLEASALIKKSDKSISRQALDFTGNYNFLWVGRLVLNKDPMTILTAFQKYSVVNHEARLYMIYQDKTLLDEVKSFITLHKLKDIVSLAGVIPNNELSTWYSAADYYISGSWKEGSGYALLEAMTCGCIPVVTRIPTFKKLTRDGRYGFLYEPGNVKALYNVLCSLENVKPQNLSKEVEQYFSNNLSFKKIADDLCTICNVLTTK